MPTALRTLLAVCVAFVLAPFALARQSEQPATPPAAQESIDEDVPF